MTVTELTQDSDLAQLEGCWNALLSLSVSDTIFLTWEWMSAWWGAYGKRGTLRILSVADDGVKPRAIIPLLVQNTSKFGISRRTFSFLGAGSNDSEYLDFIIERGFEQPVWDALTSFFQRELRAGAVFLLDEIPGSSPNLPFLRAKGGFPGSSYLEKEVPCAILDLPPTWEQYLSSLRPRFRTKVRSVLRQLESCPSIEFGFCSGQDDLKAVLPALYQLHTRRWKQQHKPGVFQAESKLNFYKDLSARLLDRDWLRCSWLKWNGQILACQFGFVYNNIYFHLQEGYEPESDHWNLGVGLRAWSIREYQRQGVKQYDFLGGFGRHKADWGATTKVSKCLTLANNSPINQVFCFGGEWQSRTREKIRGYLPKSIIAAREKFLKGREAAAFEQTSGNKDVEPGLDWKRKAVATLYFRTPALRAATRYLRERYEVSPPSQTGQTRFPISKRAGPSARILYYHRVNNDCDPFVPALPTKVFEAQMRFVSRHHSVVSLSRLLQHLREGSPLPVVAITFDDGYQDNYLNAFPILQRYGLPATIFLTTGAVDSGESLWFERLAVAIKTTSRESVDLEIDIPRRFWLRTSSEKLTANRAIFGLLRVLADRDRHEWVNRILVLLGTSSPAGCGGKMLNWMQIREMKNQQIDFGGHTVTHPFLSKLTKEQVKWEVLECKRRIQDETQSLVEFFAYPNGRKEDFCTANKISLAESGYKAALTTIWGLNYSDTDPLELRRGQPWEQDPALFAYKLDWYQLANR